MGSVIVWLVWHVIMLLVVASVLALAYHTYGDTPEHRDQVIQIVGGVVIVTALYYMSLFVLHQDGLVKDVHVDVREPRRTKIIDGYTDVPLLVGQVFETLDARSRSYVDLPRSFNRFGGAQFTYQFWIFLDDVTASNVAGKTILLRGDPKTYRWTDRSRKEHSSVAVVCPSISFGDSYDDVRVKFNTLKDIETEFRTKPQTAEDTTTRHNMIKLIVQKWALFTFVFEDNAPVSEFEDGVRVRFYVNDVMYEHATFAGTLRQNNGQLCLFPSMPDAPGGIKGARIGDLSYYNYAQGADGVRAVYEAGPPQARAEDVRGRDNLGQPLYLSEYNKLDVYNT